MATIFPQTHRRKTHTGYDSSLYENAQQKHEKYFRNFVCICVLRNVFFRVLYYQMKLKCFDYYNLPSTYILLLFSSSITLNNSWKTNKTYCGDNRNVFIFFY